MEASDWVTLMFKRIDAGEVFDFTLGNPEIDPPQAFMDRLKQVVNNHHPDMHRYTPLIGFTETRESVAQNLSREGDMTVRARHVIMTAGATAALNCIFKTLLNPGEEVILLAPYFVEYPYYIDNHGGVSKVAETNQDFSINIDAIAAQINPRTKAIIINSPNNPTGAVYSEKSLQDVGALLRDKSREFKRDIFLIADEAYRYILFDGLKLPNVFKAYENAIIAASYSKQLSIPGERVGYAVVNPKMSIGDDIMEAMTFANRILGYLGAPSFMQKVITPLQGVCVDIKEYQDRRDLFCDALEKFGYSFIRPKGTYYIFSQCPVDESRFIEVLARDGILVNPGSGYGRSGHFRIAFCVKREKIEKSLSGFKKAMETLL